MARWNTGSALSGGVQGAGLGSAGGPWGTALGGLGGLLAGGFMGGKSKKPGIKKHPTMDPQQQQLMSQLTEPLTSQHLQLI